MNKKSSCFNVLYMILVSLLVGTTLLTINPKGEGLEAIRSPLELQIEKLLDAEDFDLRGRDRSQFISYLISTANDYQFDPLLILAIMKVESSFNPDAISNRGAFGLLQIKLIAAREVQQMFDLMPIGSRQLLDPFVNLRIGVQYLSFLRQEVGGNWTRILAAYNSGPTRVKQLKNTPTGYSSKVLRTYREIVKNFS